MRPRTMFEKLWDAHVVHEEPGKPAILYIDLHLVHEVTSPQAFDGLRMAGRRVRRPDLTFATMDHNVPTANRTLPIADDDRPTANGGAGEQLPRSSALRCSTCSARTRASSTSSGPSWA